MTHDAIPPHRVFVVESGQHGWRLDRFLAHRVPRLTRSRAAKICRTAVWCDPPRKIKPSMPVRAGERVCLRRQELEDGLDVPLPDVVYRGEHLQVLNKPAGLLVHPTATRFSGTLSQLLKEGAIAGCPQNAEPVHRLDRETSGLIMIGLDKAAVVKLRAMFAERQCVLKRYLAVVQDPHRRWLPDMPMTCLDTPLGFAADARVAIRIGRGDWPAATWVRVLGRQGARALLTCQLETGRQHQIRAHLALEGTPIVGDKLYQQGDAFFLAWSKAPNDPALREQLSHPRQALHAASLGWRCPWSRRRVDVTAPWPVDFPWEGSLLASQWLSG